MRLGKLQKHAYEFAKNNPGWHTFAQNAQTKKVIHSLVKKGLIEINQFNQFTLAK